MEMPLIEKASDRVTGINVFKTRRENHPALIETLGAISHEMHRANLTKHLGAAFHQALHAPIIVNYVNYSSVDGAQDLRNLDAAKPLMKRTHDLSDAHEMRWYDVSHVVTAGGAGDSFKITDDGGRIGVVGVYTVAADARGELVDALKEYAGAVSAAAGFNAMAMLQGKKPEHAASYEVWANEESYRRATENGASKTLERVRAIAPDALIHPCDVRRVTR